MAIVGRCGGSLGSSHGKSGGTADGLGDGDGHGSEQRRGYCHGAGPHPGPPRWERSRTAAGNFLLLNVPAGQHEIRAELIGRTAGSQTVDVPAGGSATVNFSLQSRALALDGVVVTGGGRRHAREPAVVHGGPGADRGPPDRFGAERGQPAPGSGRPERGWSRAPVSPGTSPPSSSGGPRASCRARRHF